MANREFEGTNLNRDKSFSEETDLEKLIAETIEESHTAPPVSPPVKEEKPFAATPFEPGAGAKPAATPPPPPSPARPAVVEKPKPPVIEKEEVPSYEATFKAYRVGDIVKGTVSKVDPAGVLVDIGYKSEGLILPEELFDAPVSSPEEMVKVGDQIEVLIEKLESKEGHVVLSKAKADYEKKWRSAYEAYKGKKVIPAKVTAAVKGGLVVDCNGIRGFIPASQVLRRPDVALATFVGQEMPIKIMEIDRRQGKVVLSHRLAASEEQKFQKSKILNELEVGQVRTGRVTSIKNFGAFVDIGGVEGLVHLTELSWKRVNHPSDLLAVGDEVEVFVLGVDKGAGKIALGIKQLQPDPWVTAGEHYRVGQVVKGRVVRLTKFGAFVELDFGLEGLVHLSELSHQPVKSPADAVEVGQEVMVKILRIIPEEQRIGLSIREAFTEKEKQEFLTYKEKEEKKKEVTIGEVLKEKLAPPETPSGETAGSEPAGLAEGGQA